MGINLVVFVENCRQISLDTFKQQLLQDPAIGRFVWNSHRADSDWQPWGEFVWEGKAYFTWLSSPRISSFDPYAFDPAEVEPTDSEITFLKIMALVEQVAGGPIYLGNDVVLAKEPPEEDEDDDDPDFSFWIPAELDSYCKQWREIAALATSPTLIF